MRRFLLATVLILVTVVAAVGYATWKREQVFWQLVGEGESAAATGDSLSAIQAFSGAIALRPDSMLVFLRRGELYRVQGDFDAAVGISGSRPGSTPAPPARRNSWVTST